MKRSSGNGAAAVEAKGFAVSRAATEGTDGRTNGPANDRLVARVQRRMLAGDLGGPEVASSLERAQLRARAERLREGGEVFTHVRLSEFVAGGAATGKIGRVRAGCVVTDA